MGETSCLFLSTSHCCLRKVRVLGSKLIYSSLDMSISRFFPLFAFSHLSFCGSSFHVQLSFFLFQCFMLSPSSSCLFFLLVVSILRRHCYSWFGSDLFTNIGDGAPIDQLYSADFIFVPTTCYLRSRSNGSWWTTSWITQMHGCLPVHRDVFKRKKRDLVWLTRFSMRRKHQR